MTPGTPEYIKRQVASVEYDSKGTFTTCTITSKAGPKFVGTASVLDQKDYDRATSENVAYERAEAQLCQVEGYYFKKLGLGEAAFTPEQVEVCTSPHLYAVTGLTSRQEATCVKVRLEVHLDDAGRSPEERMHILDTVLRNKPVFRGFPDGGLVGGVEAERRIVNTVLANKRKLGL